MGHKDRHAEHHDWADLSGHGHGFGRRHLRGRRGCGGHGAGGHWFPRSGNREEWVRRLEDYQKDLEQRTADVADLIRRLKSETPEPAASV